MKKILFALFTMLTLITQAQVKVGNNPTSINASAVLEAESTTQGFLPPRMTTVQRDAINSPTVGLMIYNTDTKCTETFLGIGAAGTSTTGWKNLCKANINAVFQSSTLNCTGTLSGNYVATVGMNSDNYKNVTVTTTAAGDYTVSTNEVNGVIFKAEGTIQSVGTGTILKLLASGTAIDAGTFTYTVTLSGQTCTFNVTFLNPPAQLVGDAVNCVSGSPAAGTYSVGNAMTASNTKQVTVTPESIGFCNIETDVQNGVKFSLSTTFNSGQLGVLQTLNLVASGTPTTSGTFTYTVGGTDVSNGCTFTVTYACLKIATGHFVNNAAGNKSFSLTTANSGKIIYFSNADIWSSSSGSYICNQTKFDGTTITNNSFIAPSNAVNVYQNLFTIGESNVLAAGSHTIEVNRTCGSDMQYNKLQYIFIPNPVGCSEGITSGMLTPLGQISVNNTPAAYNHRYIITSPSSGKMILMPSLNMWTSNINNSLAYDIKVNGTTVENVRQASNSPIDVYQEIPGLAVANVSSGTVNVDIAPIAGFNGVTAPSMQWIHVPSTSNVTTGILSSQTVNNSPAASSHRFTLTAPAAGKYVLIGQAGLWQNSTSSQIEYAVKNGSTILETVTLGATNPNNVYQTLTYATEMSVGAAGTVNIDYVPTPGKFQGIGDVKLLWIFIPD